MGHREKRSRITGQTYDDKWTHVSRETERGNEGREGKEEEEERGTWGWGGKVVVVVVVSGVPGSTSKGNQVYS